LARALHEHRREVLSGDALPLADADDRGDLVLRRRLPGLRVAGRRPRLAAPVVVGMRSGRLTRRTSLRVELEADAEQSRALLERVARSRLEIIGDAHHSA